MRRLFMASGQNGQPVSACACVAEVATTAEARPRATRMRLSMVEPFDGVEWGCPVVAS